MNATSKPADTGIDYHQGWGATFHGNDAVNLYRAMLLLSALRTYARSKMIMTRGLTISAMLCHATAYTGKVYKPRSQATALAAAGDVTAWVNTMKAAMPITIDGVQQ